MEEIILKNTFRNALMGPFAQMGNFNPNQVKTYQLKWVDEASKTRIPLAQVGVSTVNVTQKVISHRKIKSSTLKSAMKSHAKEA